MNYTVEQIVQISKLYHQFLKLKNGFDFAYAAGRFTDTNDLAKRIVNEIIPECRRIMPLRVQKKLEMVVGKLEEEYKRHCEK